MEVIQFLIKYFLSTDSGQKYKPILQMLEKNNFDINKVMKNIDISALLPLVTGFLGNVSSSPPKGFSGGKTAVNSLSPISNIADKEIVYSLNKYFSAT